MFVFIIMSLFGHYGYFFLLNKFFFVVMYMRVVCVYNIWVQRIRLVPVVVETVVCCDDEAADTICAQCGNSGSHLSIGEHMAYSIALLCQLLWNC